MINLLAQAVRILIEMIIEHTNPPDTAGYETFEKYRHQINKLEKIKQAIIEKNLGLEE